jgi:hypothetical protein
MSLTQRRKKEMTVNDIERIREVFTLYNMINEYSDPNPDQCSIYN